MALKKIDGEFRRGPFDEGLIASLVIVMATVGAWMVYATSVGPERFEDPLWSWLTPMLGAALLVFAGLLGTKRLGIRYRFAHGEISEVSFRGQVRWREPLVTLQTVKFPWTGGRGPQMLTLNWSTHRRTIELFPSIETAVADVLRASRPVPTAPPARTWHCEHCKESNPENFELCWQCGNAATER